MPLAATERLAPHFTAAELGADQPEATPAIVANLRTTAAWLEVARGELGVPLRSVSGFRTPAHNAAVGGAPDSDHVTGLADDFEAIGLTPYQVYQRLQAAQQGGRLPPFDQLIYYAADDHIHVGLGPRRRGQVLLKLAEGSYVALAGAVVDQLRGFV